MQLRVLSRRVFGPRRIEGMFALTAQEISWGRCDDNIARLRGGWTLFSPREFIVGLSHNGRGTVGWNIYSKGCTTCDAQQKLMILVPELGEVVPLDVSARRNRAHDRQRRQEERRAF